MKEYEGNMTRKYEGNTKYEGLEARCESLREVWDLEKFRAFVLYTG